MKTMFGAALLTVFTMLSLPVFTSTAWCMDMATHHHYCDYDDDMCDDDMYDCDGDMCDYDDDDMPHGVYCDENGYCTYHKHS